MTTNRTNYFVNGVISNNEVYMNAVFFLVIVYINLSSTCFVFLRVRHDIVHPRGFFFFLMKTSDLANCLLAVITCLANINNTDVLGPSSGT